MHSATVQVDWGWIGWEVWCYLSAYSFVGANHAKLIRQLGTDTSELRCISVKKLTPLKEKMAHSLQLTNSEKKIQSIDIFSFGYT